MPGSLSKTQVMKRIVFFFIAAFTCLLLRSQSGSITDIRVSQRTDGSGFVDIYFNLSGPGSSFDMSLQISLDGGSTYTPIPPEYLNGDVTTLTAGDNKYIVWNALSGFPNNYSSQAKLMLIATETGEPPIAAFTASPTSGTAPLTVDFTDQSTNEPNTWLWDFGDGNGSSQHNPQHTYQDAGNYTVQLTVANNFGTDTETKTSYILTGSAPVAAFTANPTSGAAPLSVDFTDQSTNDPTSWFWDFGDDQSSTQQNPQHTYLNMNIYTVELTVANDHGSDTEIKSNYIVLDPCHGVETFTDTRDGKSYLIGVIGNQCWMKENLNYQISNSFCYSNNTENCNSYGRLYRWSAALIACPIGWHLPSDDEWAQMVNYLVSLGYPNNSVANGAGNALKACQQVNSPLGDACNTSTHPRWDSHNSHHGFDEFGFSAFPGGYGGGSTYNWIGMFGFWWTSTAQSSNYTYHWNMSSGSGHVGNNYSANTSGFSVRCVRNN